MSLVRPFCALVYAHRPAEDITRLVAPPYDVVTPEEREKLLRQDPHNVVALELPEGPLDPQLPGNRYETGARRWRSWREAGVIVEDSSEAVYVLEQTWRHRDRTVRRRAFVAALRLHPFSDGVVLPHERTLPKALDDRLNLTRATAANLSQVLGLFPDEAGVSSAVFDAATAADPLLVATDADGVASRVWAIRDPELVARAVAAVGDGPVFIADGHHRYTTALAYRDERRAAERDPRPADRPYEYVMAALVSMSDPDLLVLPTHRLVRSGSAFDAAAFWTALAEHFELTEVATGDPISLLESETRTAFVVRTADGVTRLARLRPQLDPAALIGGPHSDAFKRLDVTVLAELVLRPLFGIDPEDATSLERLSFAKDPAVALRVEGADVAFLLAPTRVEQVREIALAHETMPQKSTYFYPKLLSGLLFRSLR